MTIQICLSINQEHWEFLKKNPSIKPSHVLRKALSDIVSYQNGELLDDNASLSAKIRRMTDHIENFRTFIEEKGLIDEFLNKEVQK